MGALSTLGHSLISHAGAVTYSQKTLEDFLMSSVTSVSESCIKLSMFTAYVRVYLVLLRRFKIFPNYLDLLLKVPVENFHRLFTKKNGLLPVREVIYHIKDSVLISFTGNDLISIINILWCKETAHELFTVPPVSLCCVPHNFMQIKHGHCYKFVLLRASLKEAMSIFRYFLQE